MPEHDTVHSIIRRAETNYLSGGVKIGEHVTFDMHDTIEKIIAYINSRFTTGSEDSLGRPKPFFNIVTAARNITWRATDIDRKDIKFVPTNSSGVVLAFVANVLLQNWMQKQRFGQFLNDWGLTLATFGSAISKWVERDGTLIPSVVPWNRAICDTVDFDALPRIEKLYKTPGQLMNMAIPGHPDYAGYDMKVVEEVITAHTTRKNLDGTQKDNQSEFLELFEAHGLLPQALLEDKPEDAPDSAWEKFSQQIHVVTYTKSGDQFKDFTLYKGKEAKDIYQKDDLIKEDGRTLAIGPVELLFDAQWMTNHTVKNEKDILDINAKVTFQTADPFFAGRNLTQASETGDVFVHEPDKPLTLVNTSKPDVSQLQNFRSTWKILSQELSNTPDVTRGVTQAQPLTYGLGQILNNNSNSLFEIMTENKGLAIEDMCRKFIIPHLRKKLKNTDEIVAILDAAGIDEIDAMYLPNEAVRRFNDRSFDALEKAVNDENAPLPTPFDMQAEQAPIKQELSALGNKRFLKVDEIGKQTWADLLSDFEWDNIKVEVTNENNDKQAVLQTLSAVFATLERSQATGVPLSQDQRMVLNSIMRETSVVSPIQLSTAAASVPAGGGGEPLQELAA
jgi:hypothetical protein